MPVPEKDPNLWALLAAWIAHHSPTIYGFALSIVIAWLRVTYHGGRGRQRWLEAILVGSITLAFMSGLGLIGIPSEAGGFVGGMVGLFGVEKTRELALRFFGKRADS